MLGGEESVNWRCQEDEKMEVIQTSGSVFIARSPPDPVCHSLLEAG